MLTSAIQNYLHHKKAQLRRVPLLSTFNSALKAHQLRTGLKKLKADYSKRACRQGLSYHEEDAITEFKQRLVALRPQSAPKKKGELTVFWVGANRDQDESGFLQALRQIARVIEFRNFKGTYGQWYWDEHGRVRVYDPSITALNDQCLKSQIEEALRDGSIDLLMGQMWANYISKETLAWVRSQGIPIVNVSMDDRLPDNWGSKQGVRLGAVGLAPVTDLVLTTSSETCLWYRVEGCPALFWPLASDPGVFYPGTPKERDIDVLFIGNKYGIRESIIQDLVRQGISVECYGSGWPNGPATAEQSAELFKRAKIILGIGTVGYCDDVFTMKLRDFDAPMAGALYLTHRTPELAQLYEEGREIECYSSTEEAGRKIRHYLSQPELLIQVAAAGNKKAMTRDTWIHRLQSTFTRLDLLD